MHIDSRSIFGSYLDSCYRAVVFDLLTLPNLKVLFYFAICSSVCSVSEMRIAVVIIGALVATVFAEHRDGKFVFIYSNLRLSLRFLIQKVV